MWWNRKKVYWQQRLQKKKSGKSFSKWQAIKSPGPDVYSFEFYRAAWQVISADVLAAIKSFLEKGFLPKEVNSTILALIPKKYEAKQIGDYIPISCCNVFFKIILKLLANRLKKVLPRFISPNQSAFVKDRLLMESVLLASELIKTIIKIQCQQDVLWRLIYRKLLTQFNGRFYSRYYSILVSQALT